MKQHTNEHFCIDAAPVISRPAAASGSYKESVFTQSQRHGLPLTTGSAAGVRLPGSFAGAHSGPAAGAHSGSHSGTFAGAAAVWSPAMSEAVSDEALVLWLVASLFLSPWFAAGMIGLIAIRLARRGECAALMAEVPGAPALPLFCLLSLAVSLAGSNLTGCLAAIGLFFLFLAGLFVRTRMTRDLFEKIISTACVASLPGFAAMALQRLTGPRTAEFRAASLFLNANFYAAITEIVVLLCLYRLLDTGRPRRWLYALCAAVNLGGLYLSDCRSGIIALAVAAGAFLLLSRRPGILAALAALGALGIAAAMLYPGLFPRFTNLTPDLATRLSIWRTAFLGFLQNPLFGRGTQAYQLMYRQLGGPATVHAHSLILDPLLNYGVVGVTLLIHFCRENFRAIRLLGTRTGDRSRAGLIAAVLVSVAVHGLTDFTIGSLQTALLVLILLGAAGIKESYTDGIALPDFRYFPGPAGIPTGIGTSIGTGISTGIGTGIGNGIPTGIGLRCQKDRFDL